MIKKVCYGEKKMAECELIKKCPFFINKIAGDSEKVSEMKEKYCKTNNLNCARFMIATALGSEAVPPDLAPDEKIKAYEIISSS